MLIANCVKIMRMSLNARFSEASIDISTEQWIVLTHLAEQDGLTQQQLADRADRSKVAILNLLGKLEKIGFIERHPDPIDGRSNRVYLTSRGRETHQVLVPIAKANIRRMLEGVSHDEVQVLKKVIGQITTNLS